MENLIFVQVLKPVDALAQNFNGLLLRQKPSFLDVGIEIPLIAVLQNEVVVVGRLLHIVQLDDVAALATLQHFNLAFEEFLELACVGEDVPLTF